MTVRHGAPTREAGFDVMRLTNVEPADLDWIDRVIGRWDCSRRWSLWGQTPSPRLLHALLWDDVSAQQAIRTGGGVAVALLQLTRPNLLNGVAELEMLADPGHRQRLGAPVAEFLQRVFRDQPLRKICVSVAAGELSVPGYFGPQARPVGRFRRHEPRGGDVYLDLELFEIWKGAAECRSTPGAT